MEKVNNAWQRVTIKMKSTDSTDRLWRGLGKCLAKVIKIVTDQMGNYYYWYTISELLKNYFSWYKQKKWHGWTSLPDIEIKWVFGFYTYI
jgi:hypothetical protein